MPSASLLLSVLFVSVNFWLSATEENAVSVKNLKFKLNTGELIPMIGFGTWGIKDNETIRNVLDNALDAGFRHIDTAQSYGNEQEIGNTLKELLPKYNITRQEIFITSKINPRDPNSDGYGAVKESLKKLQTDYIDLYLIHNPGVLPIGSRVPAKGPENAVKRNLKWQGLVKAKNEGLVKSIGVSNYAVKHLNEILANDHGVKPAVNQIAWNPTHQPRDILELCKKEGILVVGYSSLGSDNDSHQLREDPRLKKIAGKLGKSPSQVLLKWAIQEGIAVLPKAKSKKHIVEDIELDFDIPEEDVKVLNGFEQKPALFDINNID